MFIHNSPKLETTKMFFNRRTYKQIVKYLYSGMKVAHLCPTLCDPMDYTVHGILQVRILEWVAFPFFRRSSQPRDRTQVSRLASGFFTSCTIREALYVNYISVKLDRLNEHELEQTPGDSGGQGNLVCHSAWGSQRVRHD